MRLKHQTSILVPLIIGINILIFLLWRVYPPEFMLEYFAVSYSALERGVYIGLITSVFSHTLLFHLFINMFVLNSFGRLLECLMGRMIFLKFYLLAGFVGSLTHCLVSEHLLNSPDQFAVGASGAIAGLILLFAMLFPKEKIYFFGIVPIPAFFGALAFIALDLWGLVAQTQGGGLPIGHGAHLGGAFTGIIYYLLLRAKVKKRSFYG